MASVLVSPCPAASLLWQLSQGRIESTWPWIPICRVPGHRTFHALGECLSNVRGHVAQWRTRAGGQCSEAGRPVRTVMRIVSCEKGVERGTQRIDIAADGCRLASRNLGRLGHRRAGGRCVAGAIHEVRQTKVPEKSVSGCGQEEGADDVRGQRFLARLRWPVLDRRPLLPGLPEDVYLLRTKLGAEPRAATT